MAGLNNNLYPPIFNKSYMPAFVTNCRVYFSISIYNSLSEMHHDSLDSTQVDAVQVIVQNQKTNQSVLSQTLYPSGIKLTTLGIDSERQGNDIYYVDIFNSDIEGGFNLNQYYKVQIRFTASQASAPPKQNDKQMTIDKWLSLNAASFSEWSTVVLIKPISNPTLVLNNFNQDSDLTTFSLSDIIIAGKVVFDSEDQETVQKYRIKIYDQNEDVLEDSGDIFLNSYSNINQIQYKCKYNFSDNTNYILGVQILTENLYSWPQEKRFTFNVNIITYTNFNANMYASVNNNAGCIAVHLQKNSISSLGTNIVIRRTSNKSNFMVWEDVYTFLLPANTILNQVWYDYTIENGVWYLYSAQQRNKDGFRSTTVQIPQPVMMVSEDIFLTTAEKQLKVRFDPQVSNFSHVVSESLTETIGSQYPFIRRNGNVNYRTFSLSGTITHFMDIRENLMHSSKEDIYKESLSLYNKYNRDNNINSFNDVIYEKDFRKEVIDFLYKNNIKLYRSATEGNILVKLMNISFTPNTTLGRQIYSFSCTAYEIDDFTYENCVKYNIQDQGSYQYNTNFLFSSIGQICRPSKNLYYKESGQQYRDRVYSNLQYFGSLELINTDLLNKYKKFTTESLEISIDYLSYLRIELSSKPYLIGINSEGNPYRITDNTGTEAVYLGHIAIINNQSIIIGKDGIYELSDPGTKITSLKFLSPYETGMLSYEAYINEEEKQGIVPKEYSNYTRVGQYWGFFNLSDSIYRKILNKYDQSYSVSTSLTSSVDLYEQQVQSIFGLKIQANPGIVFYLKQAQDNDLERHIIGASGLLDFYDDSTNIQGLYFIGPHLRPAVNNNYAKDEEFIDTGLIYSTFEEIKNPIKNGVYTIINPDEYNPNLLSVQGLQDFDISMQNLISVANIIATTFQQETLKVNNKIYNWLKDNNKFNNLSYKEKQIFTDLVYQAILKQYIQSSNKYIYYEGGWYTFTEEHDVVVPSVQAIIDYYCTILRKRY